MAIQAWTGSGVVGPIDVMGPQESPEARARRCTRQGELGWALLGLVGGGPGLGWDAPCLGGWAGPEASLRHKAGLSDASVGLVGCWTAFLGTRLSE